MSVAEQLRSRLAANASKAVSPGDDALPPVDRLVRAAVLVAVTEREEPGVILTVRKAELRTHAGQIAFPGGRIDADESPTDAALREAWEELGLESSCAEPIAELDEYRTGTGYLVVPVLATVPPDQPLAPHEAEVADWFEAPLGFLLDPANHGLESALFQGRMRHYYRIDWNGRNIWGATAAMLVNLSRRLGWS